MTEKPAKPYPDFPLFPHRNGQWAKTIRGKHHYFGVIADWESALNLYLDDRDDLYAGRTPNRSGDVSVSELTNRFLGVKKSAIESGELSQRTWKEYSDVCDVVIKFFGRSTPAKSLEPDDFAKLRAHLSLGVVSTTLANRVRLFSSRKNLKYLSHHP